MLLSDFCLVFCWYPWCQTLYKQQVAVPREVTTGKSRCGKRYTMGQHETCQRSLGPLYQWLENGNLMLSLPIMLLFHPVSLTAWYRWLSWTNTGWWENFYCVILKFNSIILHLSVTLLYPRLSKCKYSHSLHVFGKVRYYYSHLQIGKSRVGGIKLNNQGCRTSQTYRYGDEILESQSAVGAPDPHYF